MHFNVLPVFKTLGELGSLAESTYATASKTSFLLSGTVTCSFGLFGYVTFLNETDADILNNFRVSGSYISSFLNVVRAMYGVGLMLAFPVVLWEARENIKKIIFGTEMSKQHASSTSYSPVAVEDYTLLDETTTSYDDRSANQVIVPVHSATRDSFRVHALLSIGLVILTSMIGAAVTNLEVVFGLVGSTCTPVIAYVLPALVYIKSGAAAKNQDEILPRLTLGVGLFLIPFGLTVWILTRVGML